MKRFWRSNSSDNGDGDRNLPSSDHEGTQGPQPEIRPSRSINSNESQDSLKDLRPMFGRQGGGRSSSSANQGVYDASLNLNPTISDAGISSGGPSDQSSNAKSLSIFSSKQSSYSSKQSSRQSSSGSGFRKLHNSFGFGQALHTLNVVEENENDPQGQGHAPEDHSTLEKLNQISEDLVYIMLQYDNSSINLTTAVINSIDCFKNFTNKSRNGDQGHQGNVSTRNNKSLRKIVKIYLTFYDNLLKEEVHIKLKLLLVKHFNDFAAKLKNDAQSSSSSSNDVLVKPRNFAVGERDNGKFPNEEAMSKIIDKMSQQTTISVKEQNGSFVAPIMRGVSDSLKILCLYFGYPDPQPMHQKLAGAIQELYDDIHIIIAKNRIELASASVHPSPQPSANISSLPQSVSSSNIPTPPPPQKFKLPFRIPTDPMEPPMSMSISTESSLKTSGTVGGYIYPKINLKKQPHLKSYTTSKFAISCGHVCLDSQNPNSYANIAAPSAALIALYKQALRSQYDRAGGAMSDSRVAYKAVLNQLEKMFPQKDIKVFDKERGEHREFRNLPQLRFGQIIWGERSLIALSTQTNAISGVTEKKLSDLAIIKVNKQLRCSANYLGDDVAFNEYDPALIMDNMYVRKVLNLKRFTPKPVSEDTKDVDSQVSSFEQQQSYHGIEVFKYGSTTKYTRGNLNGIKLVYWLDGAMHSSEFIVNSQEHNVAFASGGDSGSWVLTKLQDLNPEAHGLGVLGMLHSYDGEFKQFGLFTPMCEILTRLEEVTSIKWGVVGCSDEKEHLTDSDSSSDLDSNGDIDDIE
ncbi:uncharacterized protein LODBEIA_P17960 [Lodderomyces beijingensis]|uniref:SPS-sensor serine protease component SSY5 n=1 Tax=Lodderomyces beijingensis TaxID=1775926 RepID=A0ABP0ZHC4_9ASCO